MGCQASSKGDSEESRFVFTQELTLGFSQHSTAVLEATFYRLMIDGLLRAENVPILCKDLGLDERVKAICEKLTDLEGNCSGKKLLLYAVSLSRGSDEDKALALWNLYAKPGEACMQPTALEDLLKDLLTLALTLSPVVCVFSPMYSAERLQNYVTAQTHKLTKAVSALKSAFLSSSNEVSRADFVEKVKTKTVEIASTRAVRRVIEQTKAMPTRFSAAFRPTFSSALSTNPA